MFYSSQCRCAFVKNVPGKYVEFMRGLPKLAAYFSKGTANTSGVVSTTARAASSAERKKRKEREGGSGEEKRRRNEKEM